MNVGTSQQASSPKFLIGAHQTRARADTAYKNDNIAIFDNLNLQNYYVEIDSIQYPRDSFLLNYGQNDYIEKYIDLKLFFKECIGQPILSSFMSYPVMKTKYPIEIIDLRHQTEHITSKKIQQFHDYSADPENAKI